MFNDIDKFLNLASGVFVLGFCATLGIVAVCKLLKWAPINITVNVTQRDPDE